MSTMYPFERFTERAKKVLTLAQEEAERSHHSYIGTEHLLLGLLREGEGLAALDQVPLSGLPRGRELATIRGELRVKHGRCVEGRSDLSDVLAKGSADGLGRRAARAIRLCP